MYGIMGPVISESSIVEQNTIVDQLGAIVLPNVTIREFCDRSWSGRYQRRSSIYCCRRCSPQGLSELFAWEMMSE